MHTNCTFHLDSPELLSKRSQHARISNSAFSLLGVPTVETSSVTEHATAAQLLFACSEVALTVGQSGSQPRTALVFM